MGKSKSRRPSLKMAAVIRKKAKAKRERLHKEAKTKQYPKRSKKVLIAPDKLPNKSEIEAHVHDSSEFLSKVLRPMTSGIGGKKDTYNEQINQMRKDILEQHKKKVELAKESYSQLLEAIAEADCVVEVVDARDPLSCRLVEAEGEAMVQSKPPKPLIIALNKIDLVPQEVALNWAIQLNKEIPTVAISATNRMASQNALLDMIKTVAPQAEKIAVIGLPGVGKTTICQFDHHLREIMSYNFQTSSGELGLLQAVEYIDPITDLALETIERCQESLFTVFGIAEQEEPEGVLNALKEKWGGKRKEIAQRFMDSIWNGEIKWFAVPDEGTAPQISESQKAALGCSTPYEMCGIEFLQINPGEPINVDEALLGETEEEEEGEAEDEGEEQAEE